MRLLGVLLALVLLPTAVASATGVGEVARGSLLGDAHVDGDAAGNAVVGWSQLRGEDWAVYAADVRDGRVARRPVLLGHQHPNLTLADLDVSPAGTTAACLIDVGDHRRRGGRVRVQVRRPGGTWGRPVFVGSRRRDAALTELVCAVADDGTVLLSWWAPGGQPRIAVAAVDPAGTPGPVRTVARRGGEPAVGMSGAGEGTVLVTEEDAGLRNRRVRAVQRGADGRWTGPFDVSQPGRFAAIPVLAVGGENTRAAGWISDQDGLDLVSGDLARPARQRFATGPNMAFTALASGPAGGLVATWDPAASTGDGRVMRAALRAPGSLAFGAPATFPNVSSLPVVTDLAADGTGHVAYLRRKRRPVLVARSVGPPGWSPERRPFGRRLALDPVGVVARPGGRALFVALREGGNRPNRLLLASAGP